MTEKIIRFIEDNQLIDRGDTVVVGLSGGADSTALLLSLSELGERLGITVEALHVNHNLRGEESDRDEQFCRNLCTGLNIPFTAVSCDVRSFSEKNGLSTEEAARRLRYAAFAENTRGKLLATAHNANDVLETMILNLARGSALKGMCGIPPKRDNIVRPLLAVSREDIEDYLNERGQNFVTDSTNLIDDCTRNIIRHQIMPVLRQINPSVVETSVRSAAAMRSENEFIEELTSDAMDKCERVDGFSGLSGYSSVIRRRCLAALLTRHGLPYSNDRLSAMDDILVNGGKLCISGDIYFISDRGRAKLMKIQTDSAPLMLEKELLIGENSIFPSKKMICELVLCDEMEKFQSVHKKLTSCMLDYDKINGRAVVRNRRNGDRIRLSGRTFTSSVKKLINERIAPELRPTLHFISDAEGTIWAEGIGMADRVTPDNSTKKLLVITIENN